MKKTDLKKNSAKSFSSAMIGQNFFNTIEGDASWKSYV